MWNLPFLFRKNSYDHSPRLMRALEDSQVLTRLEVDIHGELCGNLNTFLDFFQGKQTSLNIKNLQDIVSVHDLSSLHYYIVNAIRAVEPQVTQATFHIPGCKGRPTVECHVVICPHNQRPQSQVLLYILPISLFGRELEALQMHRLVNLGSLSAGVAHDLNNLLTGINSFTTLLESDIPSHERKAYLDLIRRTVGRASRLTGGILNYLQEESCQVTPIDPLSCVRDMVLLVQQTLSSDIQLTVDLPTRSHPLLTKRSELSQVILNLLVNARDAIEGSGKIEIQGRFEPLDNPNFFSLSIKDSGRGIAEEDLPFIFQPFFTTKQSNKRGTGLGLSIVQKIINEAGGRVTVDSQSGELTCFSIRLPITDKKALRRQPLNAPGGHETIFICSLNQEDPSPLQALLKHKGYNVQLFEIGHQEIEKDISTEPAPDLLILDAVSGLHYIQKTALAIRAQLPDTPLLLTGSELPELDLASVSHIYFLKKPFEAQELWHAVRHALHSR